MGRGVDRTKKEKPIGFYTLEKIVKLSPSKKDDIIFDAVIKPVWDKLPFGK